MKSILKLEELAMWLGSIYCIYLLHFDMAWYSGGHDVDQGATSQGRNTDSRIKAREHRRLRRWARTHVHV